MSIVNLLRLSECVINEEFPGVIRIGEPSLLGVIPKVMVSFSTPIVVHIIGVHTFVEVLVVILVKIVITNSKRSYAVW